MCLLFKIANQVRDFGRHHGTRAHLAQAVRVRMGRVMLHPVKRREQLFERALASKTCLTRGSKRARAMSASEIRSINIVPEVRWCDCGSEYRKQ